ncbi:uncharacterized membrane protein YhaH (DUF805 family) [Porphyromonas loveana]|uniref:Uncharacterized membrane protein YhaH (DUF805 family) n=2 Tax=Porphyromonas loveana TaxID=1884669 RepID=A0A2U1FHA4_9PORP|nr:uncharacterized membrane protein YhaH (DUF805 family) [Porphyromonas loveana]
MRSIAFNALSRVKKGDAALVLSARTCFGGFFCNGSAPERESARGLMSKMIYFCRYKHNNSPNDEAMRWFLLCLRKYVDFRGRSRRKEYWYFVLFQLLISLIPTIALSYYSVNQAFGQSFPTAIRVSTIAFYLLAVFFFLPNLSSSVRRLHDTNRSGLWILISVIPTILTQGILMAFGEQWMVEMGDGELPVTLQIILFLGFFNICASILLIIWLAERGTKGDNRFGPDPLADGSEVPAETQTGE